VFASLYTNKMDKPEMKEGDLKAQADKLKKTETAVKQTLPSAEDIAAEKAAK